MKLLFFLSIIVLNFTACKEHNKSNNSIDIKLVQCLKEYNVEKAEKLIKGKDSSLLKSLFSFELEYLKNGSTNNIFNPIETNFNNDFEEVLYNYYYGDYLKLTPPENPKLITKNDSLRLLHYEKAYRQAKKIKDTLLAFEALRRINLYYRAKANDNENDIPEFIRKQKELYNYSKDSIDAYWALYYNINVKILTIHKKQHLIGEVNNSDFQRAIRLANSNKYLEGIIYNFWGIHENLNNKDPILARYYYDLAQQSYKSSELHLAKKSISDIKININIAEISKKESEKKLIYFRSIIAEKNTDEHTFIRREYAADWLYQIYKSKGQMDSALYFNEQKNHIEASRRKFQGSFNNKYLERKFDTVEKDQKISNLKKLLSSFKQHKLIYGSIILFVFLLAAYSVYRWLDLDKKNKKLKELVIKDHIVLKNKIRIQLDELMYVQSSGHYVSLFTIEKEEFVRWSIGRLEKELPPNFKRCHNSFIVNENFIRNVYANEIILKNGTNVKLSRKYQPDFKNKK